MKRRKTYHSHSPRKRRSSFPLLIFSFALGYFCGVRYPKYFYQIANFISAKTHHDVGKFLVPKHQDSAESNEKVLPERNFVQEKSIAISADSFQVRFSPNGGCLDFAKSFIDNAEKYVLVQGYSFTSELLAKALVAAHKRGVKVMILLDKSQPTAVGSQIYFAKNNGIPVAIDYVPGIAHNKIMIIDDTIVLTGSFNWTMNAEKKNAENLLMINNEEVAKIYKENWLKRSQGAIKFLESDRKSYEKNERLYRKGKVPAAKADYTMME